MCETLSRGIKLHSFDNEWGQMWFVQWCDASDGNRRDGSESGGLVTGTAEPKFSKDEMAPVLFLSRRSFKRPQRMGRVEKCGDTRSSFWSWASMAYEIDAGGTARIFFIKMGL